METSADTTTIDDFFAQTPDMVFLATLGGVLLRASAALTEKLGQSADTRTSLPELVHPDERGAFDAEWAKLTSDPKGEKALLQYRLRLPDGSYRSFLCTTRRAPGSSKVCGSLKPTDVDTADQNRARLLLNAITSNLDLTLWEIDRAGDFQYHAGKAIAASGQDVQFVGQNIFKMYAGNTEGLAPIYDALAGKMSQVAQSSHGLYWENWILPIRDGGGPVTGVAGVSLNVTPTKRIEQELVARIELVEKQKEAIQAMSIPIIQVWDDVLTVPLVGIIDSTRAGDLMEKLLSEVMRTRASFAILDLTGVDAMDTGTASHMLRLVSALRLLGAEGILTGIRPNIAQTMVGLGLDIGSVKTLSNLRDGLRFCMEQNG